MPWTTVPWPKLPFLLHATVETAAAISFILHPDSQLPRPVSSSPAARLILQSLGGLLITTSLVCLVFLARPRFDDTSRLMAASLATWHVWPCRRAWLRLTTEIDKAGGGAGREKAGERDTNWRRTFGGPAVHLGVHVVLLASLLGAAVAG